MMGMMNRGGGYPGGGGSGGSGGMTGGGAGRGTGLPEGPTRRLYVRLNVNTRVAADQSSGTSQASTR